MILKIWLHVKKEKSSTLYCIFKYGMGRFFTAEESCGPLEIFESEGNYLMLQTFENDRGTFTLINLPNYLLTVQ